MIERRDFLKYSLLATSGLGTLALPGCGGGDSALSPATPFTYVYDTPYEVGTPIEPIVPSAESAGFANYEVSPSLPAGLNLDPSSGIITGTPASLAESIKYTVTATGPAGIASADLNFAVLSPALVGSSAKSDNGRHGHTINQNGRSRSTGIPSHTATLLPNGKVLIVGGGKGTDFLSEDATSDAQLYDPLTKTFTDTGSLKHSRAHHSATLLGNGLVLIAGGTFGNAYLVSRASTEIYDPATGKFRDSGDMNQARGAHSATLLKDGSVLIAGGLCGGFLVSPYERDTAELFNPIAESFHLLKDHLSTARFYHSASSMPDGRVFIFGGLFFASNGPYAGSSPAGIFENEWYDTSTQQFKSAPKSTKTVEGCSTVQLADGRILITGFGSESLEGKIFSGDTEKFSSTGSLIHERYYHTSTLLPDGKVLIAGGLLKNLKSSELFYPGSSVFAGTGKATASRYGHTATLLPNGQVLLVGGGGSYNSAELYYPEPGVFGTTGLDFEVSVKTKDKTYAGTGSDIYLKIIGSTNETGYHNIKELTDPDGDQFEQADLATFRLSSNMASIGVPTKVQIKFANNGSMSHWVCEYITVTPFESGVRGVKYRATVNYEFDTDNQVKSFSFPV